MSAGRNHQQKSYFPLVYKKQNPSENRFVVQTKKSIYRSSIIHFGTLYPSCVGGKRFTDPQHRKYSPAGEKVREQMAPPCPDTLRLPLRSCGTGDDMPLSPCRVTISKPCETVCGPIDLISLPLARREDVVWPQNLL